MCVCACACKYSQFFNFETMLLNRAKHCLGVLSFTSPAIAIHLSFVGQELGNSFMACSIADCWEPVQPSASGASGFKAASPSSPASPASVGPAEFLRC